MNIKFCYKDEIHKTFLPPSTFKALLEEIKVSFGDRLPSNFILQYRDKDGDLITMSSDREYSSMLRFDAPRTMASVKIFIVPAEKSVETSFEVIDASPSFSEGGVSEFSLSSRLNSQGNKSPDRTPYGSPQKDKSLSFSDDEGDELQLTSPTLRDPVPLRNDSTNELYKTRTSIEQQRLSMPSVKSVTKNKERTTITVTSGKDKVLFSQTDQSAPLGCFEDPKSATIRSEIDRFMAELPNKKSKKSISQVQTQENQAVQRIQRAFRAYNTKKVPSPTTLQDVTNAIHKVFVDHTGDGASSYVPVECQQVLFSAITESLSPEPTNHYSPDPMTQTNGSSSELMMSRESASNLKYEDYHLRSSFPQQAEVNDSKTFELYNYQAIVGMSSSILFITDDDGQGITYKTIYLKNTGFKPWRKCLIEPCGVLTGKVAEISNLEVGDVALVTLELTGYFNVGIYSSQWRIIHEDDDGAMETVGESLKVDFIIEESNIVTTKGSMTSPKFENYVFHSFEERQKPIEEESEEDHGNESEESGEQATSNGGPYSKEYLEYREQITNKAKEMSKIFPLDSSDEILRFVMGRPGLSLDDLTTAYLARKAGL